MANDEKDFQARADQTLSGFMEALEDQAADDMEIDLENAILTLELPDGGQYVLNKHAPNREIWLSSPISGAWHFGWDAQAQDWRATKEGHSLADFLAKELTVRLGKPISLK